MLTEPSDEHTERRPERPATPTDIAVSAPAADAATFHIVGVGASAGGLESLERFFTHIPPDSGMAFVVLQHLSPDFKSFMNELLSRRTAMAIVQAEHEMLVEPNTVYLLPPMKEMIIRRRRLLLNDRDPRSGLTLPIDMFLRSLAQDAGERAVAVILSGSGSDGSRGLQEISHAGGAVFCESPESAQFNGMPLSAMRTGNVDQVLPPEQLAAAVVSLTATDGVSPPATPAVEDRGVDGILRLLRDEYGIDFSHYRASTVTRRIERRLALNRALDIDAYVEQLRSDPGELSSLYEDLLIGVTRFFRDDPAFDVLEHRIIPEIVERTDADDQIRVWVPGCATGQEAYSIAMLLHERLSTRRRPFHVKILATDVHKASLEVGGAGIYAPEQVDGIGADRLERYFTLKPEGYQVAQALRECIVFAPHNIIRDAPFTKVDLVSCRNLLIYFQPHAQKTVLTLFHFSLKPGGFLFLGSSESPGALADEFDTVNEHAKIYRKRRDIGLPRDLKLPLPRTGTAPRTTHPVVPRTSAISAQLLSVYDRLLDRFMPPSFLLDEHGHLVDSFGGVESLLKIKARRPSQNLLDMVSDDLRAVLSGALHRVRNDGESVRYPDISLPGHDRTFALIAEPLRDSRGLLTHVLCTLADAGTQSAPVLVPPFTDVPTRTDGDALPDQAALSRVSQDRIEALEEELAYAKEHLQAAVQEHEASNEELQATNEELIAANEELQSTNEELHSVNEEMYTVNAEYQKKNVELQQLNDDMEHLLNGTDVATLFLDHQLCIRRFTPRIAETFRVLAQDIGRPLHTFTHDLLYPTLMTDIEKVLRDGIPHDAQIWDKRQRCLFLRILPYRSRSREAREPSGMMGPERTFAPDGVVLTLMDISPLEQARARLAQLSAIVESSDDAIIGKTLDGVITSWNRGASRLYGYTAEEAVGRHASFLYPPGLKEEIDRILQQVLEGRPVERLETTRLRKDGRVVDVSVTFSPIRDSTHAIVGISGISRDITQLVRARQEIAEREERIRLLLDSTAEAIYGVDLSGTCIFCNTACASLLGYESPSALIGKQLHPLIHHTKADGTPYAPEQSVIYAAMRHREGAHVDDEVLWRADGTSFPAEYWSHPIFRHGEVIGAVVTFLDVTERRQAEQEIRDAVRRREQFLAMLSHELRNPLSAILSATRVLETANWPDNACHEAGQVVTRQANHMARLLDDLLDVARITRDRIVLRKESIDLRNTAHPAIEALGPVIAERTIQLVTNISDEPIPVFGDPTRLQQIQANLLSNACRYSSPGGCVVFEMRRDGEEAMIRVTDNGRGIAPEILPKIFDLFVQGQPTLDRSDGGLGIGLTLLRSLVHLHDGRVHAHSDGPGRGSVFTVYLPLETSDKTDAPARTWPKVRTVVLVEDQADARRMMQLLLESQGVTVFGAENGVDGLALMDRIEPDLALIDLGLPIMSGFDLARKARSNPKHERTRIVALSGYGQESDVQAALEAGFDEHLTKPLDPERLEQLLRGG